MRKEKRKKKENNILASINIHRENPKMLINNIEKSKKINRFFRKNHLL